MQGAAHRRERRFALGERRRIENIDIEAEAAQMRDARRAGVETARRSKEFDPAVVTNQRLRASGVDERRMFAEAALDQRPERRKALRHRRRRSGAEITP